MLKVTPNPVFDALCKAELSRFEPYFTNPSFVKDRMLELSSGIADRMSAEGSLACGYPAEDIYDNNLPVHNLPEMTVEEFEATCAEADLAVKALLAVREKEIGA